MADTITLRTSTERDVIKIVERGPQGPAGGGGGGGGSGTVTSVALAGAGLSITGSPVTASGTITANVVFGTTAGTACQGNDSRLSDARTPSAHAASHASTGSDPLTLEDLTNQAVQNGSIGTFNDGAPYGIINTSWGGSTTSYGGSIDTHGDDYFGAGGSINTSAGGGSIDTRGTGSIQFGVSGTRTTLTGTATADRAVSLPNNAGTLALTSDITKTAVGLGNVANVDTTDATNISSGILANARVNWAAPAAIGSTTPNTIAATDLSASNKLSLPSAAAASPAAGDVYRVSNTLRYRDSTNAERLILNATDNLANLNSASTARTNLGVGSSDAVTFGSLQNTPIGSTTASSVAATTLSATPAANTSALTSTGYSLTGSNAQSLIDLSGTWNTTGTPTALKLNVTNTASNAASLLLDLQTGGTSRVSVRQDGRLNAQSYQVAGNTVIERAGGFNTLNANCIVGWGGTGFNIGTTDLTVERDAADTLAQRRATNAQEFRLYGTFTSSTNYQRLTVKTKSVTLSGLSGASVVTTGGFIPDGAVLVGLTTRVSTAITGATGYDIGDGTDPDRWGANIGVALNTSSDNTNWTATTIQCFTAAQEVTLTAVGSNFTGGAVQIVAHYLAGEAD